jgi:hypothetical protein
MSCPADAIKIGDYSQIMRDAARYGPTAYHPEYKTQNRVFYIGLPKTFVTGALVDANGECLVGATVTATDTAAKTVVGTTTSDDFGDFWFDGLTANRSYDVTISAAGKTKTVSVSLDTDKNLGDIQLV